MTKSNDEGEGERRGGGREARGARMQGRQRGLRVQGEARCGYLRARLGALVQRVGR